MALCATLLVATKYEVALLAFPSWFEQPIYRLGGDCVIQLRHGNILLKTLYSNLGGSSTVVKPNRLTTCPTFEMLVRRGAEFVRGHAVLTFELAIEVGYVVVTHLIGNGGDVVVRVAQLPSGNG